MAREVEFTELQEELVGDVLASLANPNMCENTEIALALLAHATTQLILKTIAAPEFVPVAVNQVIECLRMNTRLPLGKPVIDAEQLGDRHNIFISQVQRAVDQGHRAGSLDKARGAIRAAGASYAQWFSERGVELVFKVEGEVNGAKPR